MISETVERLLSYFGFNVFLMEDLDEDTSFSVKLPLVSEKICLNLAKNLTEERMIQVVLREAVLSQRMIAGQHSLMFDRSVRKRAQVEGERLYQQLQRVN